MTMTISAEFESADTLRNVKEDLVATGIEQERIYVDKDQRLVKVIVSDASESEITEIFERHQPKRVFESRPDE